MNHAYPFNELQQELSSARNLLIAFPQKANFDQVAASLALYLSLKRAGKNVSIISPEPMRVEFSHLVGVDQVANKIIGGDLVVTLDYPVADIDKVSYNDEGGKLNLVVKVKSGAKPITQEQAIFNAAESSHYDLTFAVGVVQAEDLGQLHQGNQDLLKKSPVVSINNGASNVGTLNLINPQASACTEIVASLIKALALPVDEDIGSNLLLGLKQATGNFQNPKVNPDTFEAAAFALRMGGRKEEIPLQVPPSGEKAKKKPSPDWLEPKIYRGTSLS
jgi:nanoRNase/pAp phosphatase (c-di-AMP/oligoRNAs hydrolase)